MNRPIYAFKIGQQVYYHPGGGPRGKRTGPYIIVGLVRQSSGVILFKLKDGAREQLAEASEMKLALKRKDIGGYTVPKSKRPQSRAEASWETCSPPGEQIPLLRRDNSRRRDWFRFR